jgi:hypothetical protein
VAQVRRRASVRACLVAVTVLTLVPACGGDAGTADDPGTPTSATPSPTTETGTGSTTPTKKKKKNVIAWILGLGPGAPDGPPEFTAYRELQQRRCGEVFDRVAELDEPAVTLYTGAANACLAAFEGRADLWPKAADALAEVDGRAGELTCMDRAALALLERVVRLHEKHPSRSFQAAADGKSKPPPCPSITSLEPDRGVAGTIVRMSGRHLDGDDVVGVSVFDSLGNSLTADVDRADGSLQVTMPEEPPSEASASVCVVVRADPDWRADGAMFTYESDTTGPPSTFACPPPEDG